MNTRKQLSSEDIRAMDGPTLTQYAYALALDPRDSVGRRYFSWQRRSWGEAAIDASGNIWRPHEHLAHADAVLRVVRKDELGTQNMWDGDGGIVTVTRGFSRHFAQRYGRPGEDTEAMAMLRCAVLALHSWAESEDGAE